MHAFEEQNDAVQGEGGVLGRERSASALRAQCERTGPTGNSATISGNGEITR